MDPDERSYWLGTSFFILMVGAWIVSPLWGVRMLGIACLACGIH